MPKNKIQPQLPQPTPDEPIQTVAMYAPPGMVTMYTNDVKVAARFFKMLEDPLCEWAPGKVQTKDGRITRVTFFGPAYLLTPKLRKKPAPKDGFKKGNVRGKERPAQAPAAEEGEPPAFDPNNPYGVEFEC